MIEELSKVDLRTIWCPDKHTILATLPKIVCTFIVDGELHHFQWKITSFKKAPLVPTLSTLAVRTAHSTLHQHKDDGRQQHCHQDCDDVG